MGVPLVGDIRLEQPDVIGNMQRAVALRSLQQATAQQQQLFPGQLQQQQQQLQLGQQQLQAGAMQLGQTAAANTAYHDALETDDQGQIHINNDKLMSSLAQSGHGAAIPSILKNINDYQKSMADLTEAQQKVQENTRDSLGSLGAAIQKSGYDPRLADLAIEQRLRMPGVPPAEAAQLNQWRQQFAANPGLIKTFADNAVMQSAKQQQQATTIQAAQVRAGEGPLTPQQIQSYNRILPPQMQLSAGASKDDVRNAIQMLESNARLAESQNQHETANQFRQMSLNLQQQALALRTETAQQAQETRQLTPVIGTDPKTGQSVLVSQADAKNMNLKEPMKAEAADVSKSVSARHWVEDLGDMPGTQNAPPDQMGIRQLIDRMDQKGKLGPLAGRWNDFMAGRWGAGDPDYQALKTKLGLSNTLLMNMHVGARGGSYMLEHFEDMANAKKMDAATLRSGFLSELDYAKKRAMRPPGFSPVYAPGGGAASAGGAPAPGTHQFSLGAWKRANPQGDVNAARAAAQQQGYTVVP